MPRVRPVVLALLLLAALPAGAAPLAPEDVPAPLKPWIPWVLQGAEEARCSWVLGGTDHRCLWPARLELALDGAGGRFAQAFDLEREGWVSLPGDARRRPLEVAVDGRPATVVLQGTHPVVHLPAGAHRITGRFRWDALPEAVRIPRETGLFSLVVDGTAVPFPQRETDGRVWLHRRAAEETSENRLEVLVHRKVVDEIPLRVVTRVELRVSGEGREVVLGPALLPGFVPLSLDSPLPARVESDGRVRVQVRPGTWVLTLAARRQGAPGGLALAPVEGPWAPEEVWVFEAVPSLRIAEVEGVPAIDPQQTRLPAEWRSLPAYRVAPGDTFTLAERRRGDADPAPDRLALNRDLWLDFDGGGLTIHDTLSGTLHSGWRLEMPGPTTLGRVSVDGNDQLITRLTADGPAGVEIRRRQVKVEADSRWEGSTLSIPAVGWDHDFHSLSARLRLPPGWRVFHASGVDDASRTWIGSWSLLDLFLVLVLSLSVWRLWGWLWGALALLTLVLVFPEADAPRWAFAFVLAGEGLLRVLPAGRLRQVVGIYRLGTLVILAGIAVLFSVQQVRQGMYPVLERAWARLPDGAGGAPSDGFALGELAAAEQAAAPFAASADALAGGEREEIAQKRLEADLMSKGSAGLVRKRAWRYQVDPQAVVQTGPGLPRWSWNTLRLTWSGPVARGQTLGLWLWPPWLNLGLAFVRVGFLAALLLLLGGRPPRGWPSLMRRAAPAAVLMAALLAPAASRAEVPPQAMLDDLRARLTAPPECLPTCASVPSMRLEAAPEVLTVRLEVLAAAPTALPLPGTAGQWEPTEVRLDDRLAPALARTGGGRLWVRVPEGRHRLVLAGPLPHRDVVQVPLQVRPGRVEARADGWTVDGLHEDGLADESLQLTRVRKAEAGRPLEAAALPAFVRVTRTVNLGLTWAVETTLERLTPPGTAVVLAVPLLPGESPTTDGLRVEDGKALVNMAPQAVRTSWRSALEPEDQLTLTAPEGADWTEIWQLAASPIWHVKAEGLPPIHGQADSEVREWHPRPGERLVLQVTRPEAVPGQSLTLDHALLSLQPGARATDATLTLSLRSSRGGQHTLTLPEGAVLQKAVIDGAEQPVRQEGRTVSLPLHPGSEKVQLDWREDRPLGLRWQTPPVDLGVDAVNVELDVSVPQSRWVLFLTGPRAGPAVLFWSLLIVLLLASEVLFRIRLAPLRLHDWLLLGIGLSQVSVWLGLLVAGWLLLLGRRGRTPDVNPIWFDWRQLLLGLLTVFALGTLFFAVQQGLLGRPEMQITGNGSSAWSLHWFTDRSGPALPTAQIVSVPLMVYRLAMLAWALWLAVALLGWLKWGWNAFREGGLWKPLRPKVKAPVPARPAGDAPAD